MMTTQLLLVQHASSDAGVHHAMRGEGGSQHPAGLDPCTS